MNRYLAAGIAVQCLFFLVVLVGLYARLEFPSLELPGGRSCRTA